MAVSGLGGVSRFLLVATVLSWVHVHAVVLHPGTHLEDTPEKRPPDEVMVRWSYNASAVAVGPCWLLTTCHQNTNPATVQVAGVTYDCHYMPENIGGPSGSLDIRLIMLTHTDGTSAQLTHYTPPYFADDEIGEPMVMGGYGDGWGGDLQSYGLTYAYLWDDSDNSTLRWGTNIVDGFYEEIGSVPCQITADFDDLDASDATECEAALAEHDSGGGWFIRKGGVWYVVGLSRNVEHMGQSRFRSQVSPWTPDPDAQYAVRVSTYIDWLDECMSVACADTTIGDVNGDCRVDFGDVANLGLNWGRTDCDSDDEWCDRTDIDRDCEVAITDLTLLAANWLSDVQVKPTKVK